MKLEKRIIKICKYIRVHSKEARKPYRCVNKEYCEQKIDYAGEKYCGRVIDLI